MHAHAMTLWLMAMENILHCSNLKRAPEHVCMAYNCQATLHCLHAEVTLRELDDFCGDQASGSQRWSSRLLPRALWYLNCHGHVCVLNLL